MNGRQTDGSAEKRVDRGQVAVAHERGSATSDGGRVEALERVQTAITAANGDDRVDVRPRQRLLQLGRAGGRQSGDEGVLVEDPIVPHRIESEAPQLRDASIEFLAREGTSRRDEGDTAALAGRAKLREACRSQRHAAISSATA